MMGLAVLEPASKNGPGWHRRPRLPAMASAPPTGATWMRPRVHVWAGIAALFGGLFSCPAIACDAPPSAPPKTVVFLAQDLRNGGIAAAFRSFQEASKAVGWTVSLVNLQGNSALLRTRFTELAARPVDAIVLGGTDERALADLAPLLSRPGKPKKVVVGWHTSDRPGPGPVVFTNVTTDPALVADMAVAYLMQTVTVRAGVVLINDSRFAIANYKTQRMIQGLRRCKTCEVLSVEDIPISQAGERMADAVKRLQARWGKRWTHVLTINDIYLDSVNVPEAPIGRSDIIGIAAGDGSRTALTRIRTGRSKLAATVAEPVGLQGWQLVDELLRAFSGAPPSTNVGKPVLVTAETLRDRPDWDPLSAAGEQEAFRRCWREWTLTVPGQRRRDQSTGVASGPGAASLPQAYRPCAQVSVIVPR